MQQRGLVDADEERRRLDSIPKGRALWRKWGPYLSERAWSTVREDYSATGEAWEFFRLGKYLERACQTLVLAYSTGQKLNVLPPDVAERTARGWEDYQESAFAHFAEMKQILDAKDPSYAE